MALAQNPPQPGAAPHARAGRPPPSARGTRRATPTAPLTPSGAHPSSRSPGRLPPIHSRPNSRSRQTRKTSRSTTSSAVRKNFCPAHPAAAPSPT
jgi:hypothetical protein